MAEQRQRSTAATNALTVIDLAQTAATAYDRPDLGERLNDARDKVLEPAFHVLVVGEFKQGKSTLINALLNAPLCPVDDDIATAVPTLIRYNTDPTAAIVFESETGSPAKDRPDDDEPMPRALEREDVSVGRIREYVTESAYHEGRKIHAVEVGIPRKLLTDGLVLVDTPGVGGLGSAHTATTIGALPMADAVVFVSDASQEFSGPELEFMQTALSMCPNLYCVLSKIDFYPAWRKVLDLNEGHLRNLGIEAPIQPASSTLRELAVKEGDRDLNAESGFTELVTFLSSQVVGGAEKIIVASAMAEVMAVTEQLSSNFAAEKSVLSDPEAAQATLARLEDAKAQAETLKGQLARWQQTLGDGVQDLQANVDFDLRQRFRLIQRQGDDAINESDPIKSWSEFEPWLYRRVAEDVTNNYRFLNQEATGVVEDVAEHFRLGADPVAVDLAIHNPTDVMAKVAVEADLDVKKVSGSQQILTSVRGGYYGSLMFTALGGMAGLALGPIAMGAGLILGRKSLKDEKERALMQRRQQAKNSVRVYNDEVMFLVGSDSRATLRQIQRTLRDSYTARAEELHKSTTESLMSAQKAAQTSEQERQKRLRDIEAELNRIASLRDKALKVTPAAGNAA